MPAAIKKEKVVELVLAFIEREGRNPVAKEFNSKDVGCSICPIRRIWKTLENMYDDIGVLPNRINWDKERVIEKIEVLTKELGHTPTEHDIREASKRDIYYPGLTTIQAYFGSLELLYEICEILPNKIKWDEKKVVKQIKKLILELGHFPLENEIENAAKNNLYYPSASTIRRHVGSYEILAEKCDKLPNRIFWDRDKVIERTKVLIEKLGHFPCIRELDENSTNKKAYYPSASTVRKHLGTMEELALICDESPNRITWNEELIIQRIKEYSKELGYFPSQDEIAQKSTNSVYYPGTTTIYEYIGTMEELAKACGEKYMPRNGFSVPVDDPIYGYFVSTIEHRIFHQLLKYIEPEDIERQVKYSELFEDIDSNHTADFYLLKYDLIIEATSEYNGIPGYSKTKEWKESLSDNVIFVYSIEDVDNIFKNVDA